MIRKDGLNIAAFDQMQAALKDIASLLGSYRASLLAAGFTREEAIGLVAMAQTAILAAGKKASDGD